MNHSLGSNYIKVDLYENLDEHHQQPIRATVEVLDRNDGSYIVRFMIFQNLKQLYILIRNTADQHISESPYLIQGIIEFISELSFIKLVWMRVFQRFKKFGQAESYKVLAIGFNLLITQLIKFS